MKIAFTMDDLPLWPQSYPPPGYTAQGIVQSIQDALAEHAISGVYAFSNSWPLLKHPEMADILDRWHEAGHFIANHTHSHVTLPEMTAGAFCADIDRAQELLAPWMSKAPLTLFRHPLCHWGETPSKLAAVNEHLANRSLTPVDVTSWAYEWTWNRAYRNALDAKDDTAIAFVKSSFLEFSAAQLHHDTAAAQDWFGGEVVGITLGHNVPFFADIASEFFARLKAEGAEFVPLAEALSGPIQQSVCSVVSGEFLVLQQKLAVGAGRRLPKIPESQIGLFEKIVDMAKGQNG
jgi:hypothetical protein